jgi:protein required for attachment to host cells
MTPRTDPHAREGERFIARLADRITQASAHDAFQRLVVIAPPRALGEFRDLLPTPVRAKVVGEIHHDLTKSSTQAILEHLGPYLAA